MIKLQSFLVRHDDMTHDAFEEYWLNEHVPLAKALTGLRGYRTAVPIRPERSRYDGIAELYFDTMADFDAVLGPGSDTPAIRDVSNFESTSDRCVVTEMVHRDDLGGRRRSTKLVAILSRVEHRSHGGFVEEWLEDMRPDDVPSLRKHTTAVPVDPVEADYDGIVECYFDDEDALDATVDGSDDEPTPALDGPITAAVPTDDELVGSAETHLVKEIVQLPLSSG